MFIFKYLFQEIRIMKSFVLLAIIAFVTAQTVQGETTERGNKTEPLLDKSPALQEIYSCKPGEKCAEDIVKATGKFKKYIDIWKNYHHGGV